MKLKGKKISEVPQKSELNGEELIPFALNNDNGSVTVDTIAKYAYDKEGGDFTSRLAYDILVPGIEFIADRAEKDAFGNIITDTYITRSGAKNAMVNALKEQLPDAVANLKDAFITPNMLTEETKQLFGAETIINFPDNEDITLNPSKQLTFADKLYNPVLYSGMGCKRLRKNMINGVNTLTQNMLKCEYTRYIIQYDYDLNENTINIPKGCILDFQGGSIRNGSITGSDIVISAKRNIIFRNIKFSGTYNIQNVYSDWFDFDLSGNTTCDNNIINLIILAKNGNIILNKGIYSLDTEILLYDTPFNLKGNGATFIKNNVNARFKLSNNDNFDCYIEDVNFDGKGLKKGILYLLNFNSIKIDNCSFKNMGNYEDEDSYIADGIYIENTNNVTVSNCIIENCKRDGIFCGCAQVYNVHNCTISKCQRFGIVNDGSQGNRVIKNASYHDNFITDCDGGLHCENKNIEGYEGTLNAYSNTIINCGKTGALYFGGIVSGNRLHANIYNNIIKDFDVENMAMRAIQFSNPLSINVFNNKLDNVPSGITFSKDTYKPSSVVISGNNIVSNKISVSLYLANTDNTVITNNDISVKAGTGIHINLTSRVIITNNNIKSLTEDGTSLRAINIISTPSAVIKNNNVYGTFVQDLALWTDRTDGNAAYRYIRNYSIVNNHFRNNNLFSIPFDVENGKITFYIKSFEALVENIDGFSYTSGDSCITKSLQYAYNTNRGWIPVTKIETVEYKDLIFSESKNLVYFVKDLPNGMGGTGMYLISTGNYGFKDIYGQLYTNEVKPKYIGTHNEKPFSANQGFNYFDTDSHRPLWKDGAYGDSLYRDAMGNLSTDKFSGIFDEKPKLPNVGFAYFCTDRSTEEVGENGIMIYHKGDKVWVDAFGRIIL